MKLWQQQAYALFFIDGQRISVIAAAIGKSRETVSRFITSCPEYTGEMQARRDIASARRKEYQKDWDRLNRPPCAESMRREHDIAVKILSRERFF